MRFTNEQFAVAGRKMPSCKNCGIELIDSESCFCWSCSNAGQQMARWLDQAYRRGAQRYWLETAIYFGLAVFIGYTLGRLI